MRETEFDRPGGLGAIAGGLATAVRRPLHIDHGAEYEGAAPEPLHQLTVEDEDLGGRLRRVEPMDRYHVLWNRRDARVAYVGSKRYNLVQHRDLLAALGDAIESLGSGVSFGAIRDYGEYVEGTLVVGTPEATVVVDDVAGAGYAPPEGAGAGRDDVSVAVRFWNSFNGRSSFGATAMGYRWLCSNRMLWSSDQLVGRAAYHIKGEEEGPGVDPDYFVDAMDEALGERETVSAAVSSALDEGAFPVSWAPAQLERAGFGREYRRGILARLLGQEGPGPGGETDLWRLYNAATAHLDHDRAGQVGPERYEEMQLRAWDVLEGGVEEPEELGEEATDMEGFVEGAEA